MIHQLEHGLMAELTDKQYEEYLLNQFISRFGKLVTTKQLAHYHGLTTHSVYRYTYLDKDPLPRAGGSIYFDLKKSNDWFRANKKGVFKKQ